MPRSNSPAFASFPRLDEKFRNVGPYCDHEVGVMVESDDERMSGNDQQNVATYIENAIDYLIDSETPPHTQNSPF